MHEMNQLSPAWFWDCRSDQGRGGLHRCPAGRGLYDAGRAAGVGLYPGSPGARTGCGPFGLLQPIADGLKNIIKEETLPGTSAKLYFILGPALAIMPAVVTFAVIPLAAPLPTPIGRVDMIIADVPIGILYILALSSLGVYGIVLAGWASNNKYAFLGGLRASAQLISYEVALGLSVIAVLLLAGNVTLTEMVAQQQQMKLWFVLPLSLGFIFFLISALAETNRLPFDMPEAESELNYRPITPSIRR